MEEFEYVIRINGKICGKVLIPVSYDREQVADVVRESRSVWGWLKGDVIRQIFIEHGNCVNLITSMY